MFENMFKEITENAASEAAKRNTIRRNAEEECRIIRQNKEKAIAAMEEQHKRNMAAIEEQHKRNMADLEAIRIAIQNTKSSEEQLRLINKMIQMTTRSNEEMLAMNASMNNMTLNMF